MTTVRKLIINDSHFYKRVLAIAIPIALQSLITIGVNMLDTIMVGALGEAELSATSLANTFISIYHIFCMGIGMGASVLISRYWGMKKTDPELAELSLKKAVCIMLKITVLLALVFALMTAFAPEWIMKTYTVEADIISMGIVYLRYSVVTYFFLGLSLVCTIALRSVGQVRLPLFVSIAAFFLNLTANYSLIFAKLGMPRMGIAGAALATLIARIFETAVICGYLLFFDKKIAFRLKDLFIKTGDLIGEYFKICIPVLVSDAILAFGANAVAMVIGRLGQAFVAANAITSVTQQMTTVVIQGVSQSGAIVTGQTLGAGDREKTMDQGYAFFGLGIILGIISAALVLIISPFVIRSYQVSAETAVLASQLMNAIAIILLFMAVNSIMTKGVLRGGGDTRMLMVMDNVFLWVLSLPMGIIAGFVFHLPPFWIYILLKFDQIAKAVWCFFRLRSGKWIRNIKPASAAGTGRP